MTHFIITYHIFLVNVQTNYCKNNLLILDVKQLNKIMKLYYFHTLKALWGGQGKFKMYYGMSRVKKQLSWKRSIKKSNWKAFEIFKWRVGDKKDSDFDSGFKKDNSAKNLQSVTKYLRLSLVFKYNSALRQKFNCYFLGLFC